MKKPLLTIDDIKQAVKEGKQVFWKDSPAVGTRNRNILVNTAINKHKYLSRQLPVVIKLHGVNDFYYIGE